MGLLKALRKFLSPEGPLGEIISPAVVYKRRQGIPISSPHSMLAQASPSVSVAEIERACAPERFVAVGEGQAPKQRVRQVSLYISEEWIPRYAPNEGRTIAEIAMAAQSPVLLGWQVTQRPRSPWCDCQRATFSKLHDGSVIHRECGRGRPVLADAEVIERARLAQMQPSDAFYEGYYVTVPGKDTTVIDGQAFTGGSYIRSRKDYNAKTKGMVHWDQGTSACVEKAHAEEKAKRAAHLNRIVERNAHQLVSDRPGQI